MLSGLLFKLTAVKLYLFTKYSLQVYKKKLYSLNDTKSTLVASEAIVYSNIIIIIVVQVIGSSVPQ